MNATWQRYEFHREKEQEQYSPTSINTTFSDTKSVETVNSSANGELDVYSPRALVIAPGRRHSTFGVIHEGGTPQRTGSKVGKLSRTLSAWMKDRLKNNNRRYSITETTTVYPPAPAAPAPTPALSSASSTTPSSPLPSRSPTPPLSKQSSKDDSSRPKLRHSPLSSTHLWRRFSTPAISTTAGDFDSPTTTTTTQEPDPELLPESPDSIQRSIFEPDDQPKQIKEQQQQGGKNLYLVSSSSNSFSVSSASESCAACGTDFSVLQRHHTCKSWMVMNEDSCNMLKNMVEGKLVHLSQYTNVNTLGMEVNVKSHAGSMYDDRFGNDFPGMHWLLYSSYLLSGLNMLEMCITMRSDMMPTLIHQLLRTATSKNIVLSTFNYQFDLRTLLQYDNVNFFSIHVGMLASTEEDNDAACQQLSQLLDPFNHRLGKDIQSVEITSDTTRAVPAANVGEFLSTTNAVTLVFTAPMYHNGSQSWIPQSVRRLSMGLYTATEPIENDMIQTLEIRQVETLQWLKFTKLRHLIVANTQLSSSPSSDLSQIASMLPTLKYLELRSTDLASIIDLLTSSSSFDTTVSILYPRAAVDPEQALVLAKLTRGRLVLDLHSTPQQTASLIVKLLAEQQDLDRRPLVSSPFLPRSCRFVDVDGYRLTIPLTHV